MYFGQMSHSSVGGGSVNAASRSKDVDVFEEKDVLCAPVTLNDITELAKVIANMAPRRPRNISRCIMTKIPKAFKAHQ